MKVYLYTPEKSHRHRAPVGIITPIKPQNFRVCIHSNNCHVYETFNKSHGYYP